MRMPVAQLGRVGLVALILACAPLARAQHTPTSVPHEAERRGQLHDQAVAATAMYLSTMLLGTWGLVGSVQVIIGSGAAACAGPACADRERVTQGIVWSAIGAASAAGLTLIIAIILDVDRRIRRHALDREVGTVRLGPGPGELGLALSVAWEE